MVAGHSRQFTPGGLPDNCETHTALVGIEPTTFRSWVQRATSCATETTMPYDLIQGQGHSHGGPKYMQVVKRLMMNYDTSRQYKNFNWTDFWHSSLFGITWPSNLGCSTFGKWILPLAKIRLVVHMGLMYWNTPYYQSKIINLRVLNLSVDPSGSLGSDFIRVWSIPLPTQGTVALKSQMFSHPQYLCCNCLTKLYKTCKDE